MSEHDRLFEKWKEMLDEIHKDIRGLLILRDVFKDVWQIIGSNPKIKIPNRFYDCILWTYTTSAAVVVRRQVDTGYDAISFVKLLSSMRKFFKDNPTYPNAVDFREIQKDLSALQKKSEPIEDYATRTCAHLLEKPAELSKIPTYKELD